MLAQQPRGGRLSHPTPPVPSRHFHPPQPPRNPGKQRGPVRGSPQVQDAGPRSQHAGAPGTGRADASATTRARARAQPRPQTGAQRPTGRHSPRAGAEGRATGSAATRCHARPAEEAGETTGSAPAPAGTDRRPDPPPPLTCLPRSLLQQLPGRPPRRLSPLPALPERARKYPPSFHHRHRLLAWDRAGGCVGGSAPLCRAAAERGLCGAGSRPVPPRPARRPVSRRTMGGRAG